VERAKDVFYMLIRVIGKSVVFREIHHPKTTPVSSNGKGLVAVRLRRAVFGDVGWRNNVWGTR
jgi:hypothetical protein